MKGLTINENVADEVTLETHAVLHFETMHAITYNRMKRMLNTLIVPATATSYGSKIYGISELLPLPIRNGLHGMMSYLETQHPEEYKKLLSIASLMGVKMSTTPWGYYSYEPLDSTQQRRNDPAFDKNTDIITKKAEDLITNFPITSNLTEKEASFRDDILQALENREPFPFMPEIQNN